MAKRETTPIKWPSIGSEEKRLSSDCHMTTKEEKKLPLLLKWGVMCFPPLFYSNSSDKGNSNNVSPTPRSLGGSGGGGAGD